MAEKSTGEIYCCPGSVINNPIKLPISGNLILSLIFHKDIGDTIKEALVRLPPQWGWRLEQWTKYLYSKKPEGIILNIYHLENQLEKIWKEILASLHSRSAKYHIKGKDHMKALIISKSFIRKTRWYWVVSNARKHRIRMGVVFSSHKNNVSFLANMDILKGWINEDAHFTIEKWWKSKAYLHCSVCKMPLWVNSCDGITIDKSLSSFLCRIQNQD